MSLTDFVAALPKHITLEITHNDHRAEYQSIEQWVETSDDTLGIVEWSSPTARRRVLETGEVWQIRWYPTSPVGWCEITGPTLEEVFKAVLKGES